MVLSPLKQHRVSSLIGGQGDSARRPAVHRPISQPIGGKATEVRIGLGSCCLALGSDKVHDALCRELAATGAHAYVKQVGCTGICHKTPLVELVAPDGVSQIYTNVKPDMVHGIVLEHFKPSGITRPIRYAASRILDWLHSNEDKDVLKEHSDTRDGKVASFIGPQKHLTMELLDIVDPLDLDEYIRFDGFSALKKCLNQLGPETILDEVEASGLRGRGGAGFPTHIKWRAVRAQKNSTKYVICNGDEGDPGAFMDRMLLESIPFRVIEGMAIAAYALDSHEGIFYIRAEYPLAVKRIREAIAICEQRGILGDSVMGSDFRFKLEVREGAGAFICGEETALIHSIRRASRHTAVATTLPCGKWVVGKANIDQQRGNFLYRAVDYATWRQGTCQTGNWRKAKERKSSR